MSNVLLENALSFAKHGLFVFPAHDFSQGVCSCGKPDCTSVAKHPRTPRGLNDATRDPATITAWWEAWPDANIGINCGASGLSVIDVDCKKGALGFSTIKPIAEAFPEVFSIAPTSKTPSGGLHIWGMGPVKGGAGVIGPGIDVQSLGRYVIAPPSRGRDGSYEWTRGGSMPPWPQELRAMMEGRHSKTTTSGPMTLEAAAGGPEREAGAREGIPTGQHRASVREYAWHLRRVQGLSAQAAFPLVQAYASNPEILEGLDPFHPFSNGDLWKLLINVPANVAASVAIELSTESVRLSDFMPEDEREPEWILPMYLPLNELTLLFGEGSVGKSTLMAWVASEVTKRKLNFGIVGNEDARSVFSSRALLNGADPTRLFMTKGSVRGLKLTNQEWIRNFIAENKLDVLYFDSIRSHFPVMATDAATAARDCLEPVAVIAKEMCAIMGTFHMNKEGKYSGSTEMRNVPRIVWEIKQKERKNENKETEVLLHVQLEKTNFEMPKTKMEFIRNAQTYCGKSGLPLMESVIEIGGARTRTPRTITTWNFKAHIPIGSQTLAEAAGVADPRGEEMHPFASEIMMELAQNPNVSTGYLHRRYGGNTKKFYAEVARQRIVESLIPKVG
jgi:hypothetical protein